MRIERSQEFERSAQVVFDFVVTDHVRNHPRWDPMIRLAQLTDGPIGVGTVFRRWTDRGAGIVEGTMEVVAFEPGRSWRTVIHDGLLEMHAGIVIEPLAGGHSRMTIDVDIPSVQDQVDPSMIERSLTNMKRLIETEA